MGRVVEPPAGRKGAACAPLPVPERSRRDRDQRHFNRDKRDEGDKSFQVLFLPSPSSLSSLKFFRTLSGAEGFSSVPSVSLW